MDQDARVIRKRAERARAAIAADVDAIGDKLDVKQQAVQKRDELVDQFKERVGMSHDGEKTRLGHEAHTMIDVVRTHPMATMMAGFGGVGIQRIVAAWRDQHQSYPHVGSHGSNGHDTNGSYVTFDPTMGGSSDDGGGISHRIDDAMAKASDVADTARERVGDVADTVRERASEVGSKVGDLGSSARETAANVAMTVTEHVPSDRQQLEYSMRSNVGLWGLGAFALGAAIGSLFPATRLERERLGAVTDGAVDLAKARAGDARQALEAGLDVARDEISSSDGGSSTSGATSTGAPAVKRPGPILGSRDMETSTPDSVVPAGPIRPL